MGRHLGLIFFFSLVFFYSCSHSPKVTTPKESPRIDSRQIHPSLSKEETHKTELLRMEIDAQSEEKEFKRKLFLAKMKSSSSLDVNETLSQESLKIMKEVIYLDPTINLWGTNSASLISKLEKAIELDPFYHAAYYFLGMSYRKNSLFDKSLMSFQKAIELKPNYPEAYIQIAKTYEAAGRGKDAIASYKEGIEKGTDDAYWAYYEIALILWNEGSISEAEKNLKHAIDLKKDFSIAYYYLGLVSVKQNKYKEALEYFRKSDLILFADALYSEGLLILKNAMEKNPEIKEIYASLGLIHYKKRNYNESIFMFEKLKTMDSAGFSNYLELGISYYHAGKYREAKSNLISAEELAPESFEAHLYLGLSFKFDWKERDYNRALTELSRAVEIQPNSFLAHYNLADIYFDKNDYDSSLKYLKRAFSINPYHANTLSKMGEVYYKKRDYDKAIKYFNKSLETEKSHFVYSALAKVYADMEQYDTAIGLYKKANALGEFDLFDEDIAELFFKKKDYAGGINILQKYLAKYPKINSARFSLAVALYKTGEIEESKQAYKIILDNDPKYFAAHFNLALIYENENTLESLKKAKEHYTVSSAGFPEEARKALEECEFKIILKEFPNRMNSR